MGDKTWLDFMDAELITVSNSDFNCRGKLGETGGSMIDYFIISEKVGPVRPPSCRGFRRVMETTGWSYAHALREAERGVAAYLNPALHDKGGNRDAQIQGHQKEGGHRM